MWKKLATPIKKLFLAATTKTDMEALSSSPAPIAYAAIDKKKTKIVATIGPATEAESQLQELIKAGMNVARFNTKHNEPEWHKQTILKVRKVAGDLRVPVGILLDVQGPEIRTRLAGEEFTVEKGKFATFTSKEDAAAPAVIVPQQVIAALSVGNTIILEDGACEFAVVKHDGDTLQAQALDTCVVKPRKTMNTPGVTLDMPALLPTDLAYLDALQGMHIEFVALSFVRTDQDIFNLQNELKKRDIHADIVAKIENQKSVDNLESIAKASDGVMVARGDLGVEVPFEQMTFWQKKIIRLCQQTGKPVITATQMLASMVGNPRPTRAEVSDVANAIYDGTDAVMLSEETTIGKYPIKAVETQAKIAAYYEDKVGPFTVPNSAEVSAPMSALTQSTVEMLNNPQNAVQKIVVACDTCELVLDLARYRLKVPVIALTSELNLAQKFSLSYGVRPICLPDTNFAQLSVNDCVELLKKTQNLLLGEKVIFIYNFSQPTDSATHQPLLHEVA